MKSYEGYLIDLDGTVYKGTEKIEAAVNFVATLQEKKIPYLFVTNNSTKSPAAVAETLQSMGIPAAAEDVFTTSMATAQYVSEASPGADVYVVGEEGLVAAAQSSGLNIVEEGAEYVIMGLDREITYEKLAKAVLQVRAGAKFIATNGDVSLPTERGMMPGSGSLISVVSVSTGVAPLFIGKPESIIVEQAMEVLGTSKEKTLMVGDNYDTDILAGIRAGIDSLLVFTGVTTEEQLNTIREKPTYTLNSLKDWVF